MCAHEYMKWYNAALGTSVIYGFMNGIFPEGLRKFEKLGTTWNQLASAERVKM